MASGKLQTTYSHGCKARSESCAPSKLVDGAQGTPVAYSYLRKQVGVQAYQILQQTNVHQITLKI